MKTFKHIFLSLTTFICVASCALQTTFGQTGNYFAGTGAGTGNTGSFCTGAGESSLHSNNQGSLNSAFGYHALYHNTTGYQNTANGAYALYSNTTGTYNTANGLQALYSNTTGFNNTANGFFALGSNTTGSANTANGRDALYYNTTGYNNTANGEGALGSNTTGYNNTANGVLALFFNTTGYNNTANGYQALYVNTTGYNNTANGVFALVSNTTGYNNTANGVYSLFKNTTGNYNTANGDSALYSNTTGSYNTANGFKSLNQNTTGSQNTANGYTSLYSNTTGNSNTANGFTALYYNTTGSANTADGLYALLKNTTGYQNTADGHFSLYSNITGYQNAATGDSSLLKNTTGYSNTALGSHALLNNDTGYFNVAVGASAGALKTNYNKCTFIGVNADAASGLINCTAIGYAAKADGKNMVRIGNTAVTSIGGPVSWTSFSDARIKNNVKENVPGLAFINLLRPVTYNFDIEKENGLLGIKNDDKKQTESSDIEKIKFTGFIAQDVDKAAQQIRYDFSGVDKSGALMGLRYSDFVVPLVKAVQELSKQNDSLKNEIDEIKAMIIPGYQSAVNSQQLTIISSASLAQNTPNPFNNTTTINYALPQNFSSAQVMIRDQSGKVLKQVNINTPGKGSLNIDASTLTSGAYNYSLIIDGKLIDTKQMVLSK